MQLPTGYYERRYPPRPVGNECFARLFRPIPGSAPGVQLQTPTRTCPSGAGDGKEVSDE